MQGLGDSGRWDVGRMTIKAEKRLLMLNRQVCLLHLKGNLFSARKTFHWCQFERLPTKFKDCLDKDKKMRQLSEEISPCETCQLFNPDFSETRSADGPHQNRHYGKWKGCRVVAFMNLSKVASEAKLESEGLPVWPWAVFCIPYFWPRVSSACN